MKYIINPLINILLCFIYLLQINTQTNSNNNYVKEAGSLALSEKFYYDIT